MSTKFVPLYVSILIGMVLFDVLIAMFRLAMRYCPALHGHDVMRLFPAVIVAGGPNAEVVGNSLYAVRNDESLVLFPEFVELAKTVTL